jgi:hypothetical protein
MQIDDNGMGLRFVSCEKKDWRSEPSAGRRRVARKVVKYVDPDEDETDDINVGEDEKGKGKEVALRARSEDDVENVLWELDSDGGRRNEGTEMPHADSPAAVQQTRAAQVDFLRGLSLEPAYQNRVTFIEQNLVFFWFFQFSYLAQFMSRMTKSSWIALSSWSSLSGLRGFLSTDICQQRSILGLDLDVTSDFLKSNPSLNLGRLSMCLP